MNFLFREYLADSRTAEEEVSRRMGSPNAPEEHAPVQTTSEQSAPTPTTPDQPVITPTPSEQPVPIPATSERLVPTETTSERPALMQARSECSTPAQATPPASDDDVAPVQTRSECSTPAQAIPPASNDDVAPVSMSPSLTTEQVHNDNSTSGVRQTPPGPEHSQPSPSLPTILTGTRPSIPPMPSPPLPSPIGLNEDPQGTSSVEHPPPCSHPSQLASTIVGRVRPIGVFTFDGDAPFITQAALDYLQTIPAGQSWSDMIISYLRLEAFPVVKGVSTFRFLGILPL